MVMFGADVDALRATGEQFVESSRRLRSHGAELTTAYRSTAWAGPDADLSRVDWQHVSMPALARTSAFMEALGRTLLVHADSQRQASTARDGRDGWLGGVAAGDAAHDAVAQAAQSGGEVVGEMSDGVRAFLDRLLDGVAGCLGNVVGAPEAPIPPVAPITGLRPETSVVPADGRAGLLASMAGFADESRIARDEIEIRALDNGRYVVVLPGVTDLSQGFGQFAQQVREDGLFGVPDGARDAYDSWADNDEPTVRKMRYAYEAALWDDTTVNEYSSVVAEAMEAAGVPAGSDVMIVGHSFGAYTAIDLAVEPTFNAATGGADGYHVNVTHVVAAGAETDWRFDELPPATRAFVMNNRWDAVYQAENLLHSNASPSEPGHLEVEFWGDRAGYGHDEQNYIDWVARSDNRDVEIWLDEVGRRYTSGGTRVSVQVPDPNVN